MPDRRIVLALALGVSVLAVGVAVAPGKPSTERKALVADMSGHKEVGDNGRRGAGDPNGFGSFTAIAAGATKLCYGMTVRGVDQPVAAHIHKGGPTTLGAIVIPLTAPAAGNGGAAGDCVTVAAPLLRALFKNPSKYYVNIHTQAFPGGAVRSQLAKR